MSRRMMIAQLTVGKIQKKRTLCHGGRGAIMNNAESEEIVDTVDVSYTFLNPSALS